MPFARSQPATPSGESLLRMNRWRPYRSCLCDTLGGRRRPAQLRFDVGILAL